MKRWLSCYNVRFPRTLVYMLQATEYDIREYVSWYRSASSFRRVEQRKSLVWTPKAVLLFSIVWGFLFLLIAGAITVLWLGAGSLKYILAVLIVLLLPHFLAYGIIAPLAVLHVMIQSPIEYFIVSRARIKLGKHHAIKIGIAGSFGKTTVREILKTILSEGKKVAAPSYSINTPLGISRFIHTLKGDEDILIFELGEYYPGDVRKLCNLVKPEIGFVTGANEAHLEKFKTMEQTVKTVFELADFLRGNPVYVNGESALARRNSRPGHTVYDRTHIGNWSIKNQKTDLTGTSFTLVKNETALELQSKLLGLHHIGPLVAAVDLALKLGLSKKQVIRGVSKTKPFEHRLEPKTDHAGAVTLDDSYNGNPDGVKAVIAFLASLEGHRRFYVTPGLVEMGPRTEEVHKEIGRELAAANIEKVVLIKNSVTPHIEQGLKEEEYQGEIVWFNDAAAAFAALPHMTAEGDVVLLQNDWPDQYR